MRPSVEVHIGELVLTGFPPGTSRAIADAMQRRLTHLYAERGVPPPLRRPVDASRLDAGGFTVNAGARPGAIGVQIANAVYGATPR